MIDSSAVYRKYATLVLIDSSAGVDLAHSEKRMRPHRSSQRQSHAKMPSPHPILPHCLVFGRIKTAFALIRDKSRIINRGKLSQKPICAQVKSSFESA
jgi:hypothetical protein